MILPCLPCCSTKWAKMPPSVRTGSRQALCQRCSRAAPRILRPWESSPCTPNVSPSCRTSRLGPPRARSSPSEYRNIPRCGAAVLVELGKILVVSFLVLPELLDVLKGTAAKEALGLVLVYYGEHHATKYLDDIIEAFSPKWVPASRKTSRPCPLRPRRRDPGVCG